MKPTTYDLAMNAYCHKLEADGYERCQKCGDFFRPHPGSSDRCDDRACRTFCECGEDFDMLTPVYGGCPKCGRKYEWVKGVWSEIE